MGGERSRFAAVGFLPGNYAGGKACSIQNSEPIPPDCPRPRRDAPR